MRVVGHGAHGPSYYLTVRARFQLCDDVGETATLLVRERKWINKRTTLARASWSKSLHFTAAGRCAPYTVSWRLADKFWGIGYYGVELRVRDADGATSRPISKNWFTPD